MRLASLAILFLLVSRPAYAVTITFTDLDLGPDGQFCGADSSPVCSVFADGLAHVSMSDNFPADIVDGALEIYGGNAWFDVAWADAGPHHTFGLDLIADSATLLELYGTGGDLLFTATGGGSYSVTTALQQYGLLWHVEGPGAIVVDNIRFNPDPKAQSVPEYPTWLMAMASGAVLLFRKRR
jgi:hypothetical protein